MGRLNEISFNGLEQGGGEIRFDIYQKAVDFPPGGLDTFVPGRLGVFSSYCWPEIYSERKYLVTFIIIKII